MRIFADAHELFVVMPSVSAKGITCMRPTAPVEETAQRSSGFRLRSPSTSPAGNAALRFAVNALENQSAFGGVDNEFF